MEKEQRQTTEDSKYIQQHLANERTFLAWIRTSIAVVGIAFLVINLHEKSTSSTLSTVIVQWIGVLAVVISICTIMFSTASYVIKTKQINEQTFRPSRPLIWFLAALLLLITGLFGYYFFSLL
ncbi:MULTISPECIES: YidH family protein [Geobacillus]|jgi:putative membrane protein|uniref:YidH family protein n=2 Tax=Anoxybacillaceae TaxID=3120669 RepID=UPI000D3BC6BE|nr:MULTISPECIES: DUF202 domain-containing protein [Geobacillus]NNU88477.1 DUF202 domain-containing protein [Geobacillus sp. MR]PTR48904.1 hypothetical protein CW755_00425 [Geobacillus thermodenitrificans]